MPDQKYHTEIDEKVQEMGDQDDWAKEIVPRLPAHLEEQAKQLKAIERCREISKASDLLRGLLAYVYVTHSFQHLSLWSVLIGLGDVSANAWRKRLQKASTWLDWVLQEVLAMAEPLSPWLVRGGLKRILLIDGTHWKCFGPQGKVWRVHTAFDLLAGRLTQLKVTDCHEGEHLEIFELQKGDVIVRISPSKFPMEDEQGASIAVLDWLKGLPACAGEICSRAVWISCAHKRIQLRLIALRLSQDQQEKAERRTKQKASKRQQKVRQSTLYFSGWVLVVTTLPEAHWSDQQISQLYRARWHIELLFKRMKQLLRKQSLRCKTVATAKATITLLLLGWALLEEESAAVRLAMRDAIQCTQPVREKKLIAHGCCWQDDLYGPLSEWMLAEASFDLFCQQVRGCYTAEHFRACFPRLQRFLSSGHRNRPHLYTQVCRWLGVPAAGPEDEDQTKAA